MPRKTACKARWDCGHKQWDFNADVCQLCRIKRQDVVNCSHTKVRGTKCTNCGVCVTRSEWRKHFAQITAPNTWDTRHNIKWSGAALRKKGGSVPGGLRRRQQQEKQHALQ